MTGTVSSTQCRYCRRSENQHATGCPKVVGTKRAMEAWEYGNREGRREDYIFESRFKTLHPSRVCGYLAGLDEMSEYYNWKCQEEDTNVHDE